MMSTFKAILLLSVFSLFHCNTPKPGVEKEVVQKQLNLSEKLGYDKDAKLVLLHADDLGVSHSVNSASIAALNQGPVRSASIMMPTSKVDEIVEFAKQNKNIDIGLHLTVTSEWKDHKWGPVAPINQVSSLVDENGHFPPICSKTMDPKEVDIELRAQMAKAKKMGIVPSHFDSHMGCLFYTHPEILESYARLAKENNVPCVAYKGWIPNTGRYKKVIQDYRNTMIMVDAVHETRMKDFEQEGGIASYYANALRTLKPGLNYFILHPAYDNAEMRKITGDVEGWGSSWRQQDFDFFISPQAHEIIADEDIKVVTWKEISHALHQQDQPKDKEDGLINSVGGKQFTKEEINQELTSLMDSSSMPGLSFAVINNNEIVYHENLGIANLKTKTAVTNRTVFEAASLSKPVFAYFVLKQVDKGLLNLDEPLFNYLSFPALENDERYKKITARMVLSHTTGLPNWREGELKLLFDPGSKHAYSGEGYQYLARVLAKLNNVSTEALSVVFNKEVAEPLGIDRLYFDWNEDIAQNKAAGHFGGEPTDNTVEWEAEWKEDRFGAAGGIHTDAENYAKFLLALLQRKGLSETSFNELFHQQVALDDDTVDAQLFKASGWSLGLGMIPTSSGMSYYHGGNNGDFQSWFFIHPEKASGIVYFTNYDQSQTTVFFPKLVQLLDEDIDFNYELWKMATGN